MLRSLLLLLAWAGAARPQGIITTAAGTNFVFPREARPALTAPLGKIQGLAIDGRGNVYVSDPDNHVVGRIAPDGTFAVIAGNGLAAYSGDGGPALSAALNGPRGLALDAAGNLYIADELNQRVRKVTADGIITTVALLSSPHALAVDSAGALYISNLTTVAKLTPAGVVTPYAGNGSFLGSGDGGPATQAGIGVAQGLAVDGAGNLYIADGNTSFIRKVTPDGIISTVARAQAFGIAVDASGNLYLAEWLNDNRIRKLSPDGVFTTLAGAGAPGFSGDGGPATRAAVNGPQAVALDSAGNVYVADTENQRVRKLVPGGNIASIAGNGGSRFAGDGGSAAAASLNAPIALTFDRSGNYYISDSAGARIRKVTPAGLISTVAGNGVPGYAGDGGPAANASLNAPAGVAVDAAGNLYIADQINGRIRKVSPEGIITTVAGTGGGGAAGDFGPATQAVISFPFGVAVDAAGNVYLTDGHMVRKATTAGTIVPVAGMIQEGFAGDGGPALNAKLSVPQGLALDAAGNLYVADSNNHRIRKVTPQGIITTVAGNGARGASGDGGPATSAQLNSPLGVAVDAAGNLYIAGNLGGYLDTTLNDSRVRKVSPDGIISTVTGGATEGFSGDGGPAGKALLGGTAGVAVDAAGNLFIADTHNHRVREVLGGKPPLQLSASSLSFAGQSGGAAAPTQSFTAAASVPGLSFSIVVNPESGNWLAATPSSGTLPRLIEVTANPANLGAGTYRATIAVNVPDANPAGLSLDVTFTVAAGSGPIAALDTANLSFPFPRKSAAQSQTITIRNAGSGALTFQAAAATTSGGAWLSVSPGAGTVTPSTPQALNVTADPAGLAPGTYSGALTVTPSAGGAVMVPVIMTISTLDQAILLSQRGLSFTVVAQGGVVPAQSFSVLNIGPGRVPFTVSKSTLSGGDWLRVTPAGGVAGTPVRVSVDSTGLAPDTYYGLVQVDAPAAANSPQVLTVSMQVLPAGSDLGPMVQPGALIFTATPGGSPPGSQDVVVYNPAATLKSVHVTANGEGFPAVTAPTDATADPQRPAAILVQPFTSTLGPGVYTATVAFQFSDGRTRSVDAKVIVSNTPATAAVLAPNRTRLDAAGCTPTRLLPTLTTLPHSFEVSAGWPTALGVTVKDDCGTPLEAGSVTVTFSNGDPPVTLQPVQDGRWEGTWPTRTSSQQSVTLKLHAETPERQIVGDQQVSGGLFSQQQPPAFEPGGVVSIAGGPSFTPLAPGAMIAIYGDRLAESAASADGIPLPTRLVSTQVTMAGIKMPLYYVNQSQVNAIVPFAAPVNTPLQLLIQRGLTLSLPVRVDVASAQPGILNSGPPQFAGTIAASPADGSPPHLVTPDAPAHAGDTLVLYCSGLGQVDPPVADGSLPGAQPSITKEEVRVSIGRQPARVAFSGLSPGLAGLYQVNVVVPEGTPKGNLVAISLSVAGQTSAEVTTSIQ